MKILSRFFSEVKQLLDFFRNLIYNVIMLRDYEEVQKQARQLDRLARRLRREEMQRLRDDGMTLEEIGKQYNPVLTKERVRQILAGLDESKE